MTPELRLLASSVLWTIYVFTQTKAECRRFICRATTLKLQKMAALWQKALLVCGYFFYVGHTGTPTNAKLNVQSDKSNAN